VRIIFYLCTYVSVTEVTVPYFSCAMLQWRILECSRPIIQTFLHCHVLLLFMSMGRDYVSELRPPVSGLIVKPQMIDEYGEPWWNDIGRGKPKISEKNLSQCRFVHHKSHMDWNWAFAVRGRRLTAWAMTRPLSCVNAFGLVRIFCIAISIRCHRLEHRS
jgi:hypothetical protein